MARLKYLEDSGATAVLRDLCIFALREHRHGGYALPVAPIYIDCLNEWGFYSHEFSMRSCERDLYSREWKFHSRELEFHSHELEFHSRELEFHSREWDSNSCEYMLYLGSFFFAETNVGRVYSPYLFNCGNYGIVLRVARLEYLGGSGATRSDVLISRHEAVPHTQPIKMAPTLTLPREYTGEGTRVWYPASTRGAISGQFPS